MLGSKMESDDVAKSSHKRNLGIFFNLINMAGMAKPAHAKVRVRFRAMVWLEGGQGEVRGACG